MPAKKKSAKKGKKPSVSTKKTKGKKEMMQAHGKEEKFKATTLDQVWGDTGMTKYGHQDEGKYAQSLTEMNKSDLQAHAHYVGLVPVDNRELLTKRLMQEFRKYASQFRKPQDPTPSINPNLSAEARRILSEGR